MKRYFRSKLWIGRCYLVAVWTQISYYIYDPSKPSKAEFLKLSAEDQAAWIEENISEYETQLYGNNYLACSYDLNEDKLDEYLEYRDDYGVSGLIEEQFPSLSEERGFEIDDGAELTSDELEALRTAMTENDFDGWDTHSGFYFKVRFGALYALFVGQDIGQGGSEFELEQVFKSRRLAVGYVSEKPMVALEGRF
ncbi:ATP phosphoribosyltransferase regulatory subunit [Planktomarina sp.]|nr:ATP phosphoribosyltransferase regulatory subunit [Planktomarina temperata]MDC3222240.1 ATP phosphoribosyltransferase regulatory subunit [Planktomarina sp.]